MNKHGAELAAYPRGKRLRNEDYMSTAAQLRLEEHRANAVKLRKKHPELAPRDFYFDISQHVSHSRQPDGLLMRSATSSCIWSEAENRLLHPLEVWASQGPFACFRFSFMLCIKCREEGCLTDITFRVLRCTGNKKESIT